MKNKIFILFVISFFTTSICYSVENSNTDPIVDSVLTIDQAFNGLSSDCPPAIKNNQTLIDVHYYSTDGLIHKGQVMIDRRLADDITQVFAVALDQKFPFTSVIPISQFDWSDTDSMFNNNTSAFNYRPVTGGGKLSNHAYGFAIDINPRLNPYIKKNVIQPANAVYDPDKPGTLTADHAIVKTFLELGWEWGGNWTSLKDYQHFEKIID